MESKPACHQSLKPLQNGKLNEAHRRIAPRFKGKADIPYEPYEETNTSLKVPACYPYIRIMTSFDDPFELEDEAPAAPSPSAAPAEPAYLTTLNPEQRAAVETLDGPLLVLAGAGTGKTRVLTTRLAHILTMRRAWPGQILAVTFTNKAAREMKERIGQLIGGMVEGMPWLGTFHSLAAQILRRHAELVYLKSNFTILDTDDTIRLLKQIMAAENVDEKRWPARVLAGIIDQWKNKGLTPDQVPLDAVGSFANGKSLDFYRQYQLRLKTLNAVDFGDLLLECIALFQGNTDVLKEYQERFKYILVDEYQDTNVAQYLWLRLLAQGHKNICCVGDDDQSIYGWRGAEVDNILRFESDFPGATVIRLERNYRSTSHILGAASGLIKSNQNRLGKTLWTEGASGEKVTVRGTWDDGEEARGVSDEIERLQREGHSLREMAVLVRASSQMRSFEDRFVSIGLPYRVVGGPRFYERQEIRDANAYFRVVANPADDLSFDRIHNTPARKIGKTLRQAFIDKAQAENVPYLHACHLLLEHAEVKGAQAKALINIVQMFNRWTKQKESVPHTELAGIILDESGYMDMWRQDKTPQAPGRVDNLQELVTSMGDFDTLEGYLEHISLVMDLQQDDNTEKVTLMTLHAAKGLEFDTVFLPGWEEGLFPSKRSLDENGDVALEEERRLAYVGITRAKKRAYISHCAMRQIYGRTQPSLPSRFLEELPDDHVTVEAHETFGGTNSFAHVTGFNSTYDTPGWRRAQARRGADSDRPAWTGGQVIDHVPDLTTTNDPDATDYTVGDRVKHQKFGMGAVKAVEGNKLTVDFDTAGEKRVIAMFVERHDEAPF